MEEDQASLRVLDVVQEYLKSTGFTQWLRDNVQALVTQPLLPYNPYSWLLTKCMARATLPNLDRSSHPLPAINHIHEDDQLPGDLVTFSGPLGEEAFGLRSVLLLTNARVVRTASLIAQAIEDTWMGCIKSSLPFNVLLAATIPSLWGLSNTATTDLSLACDCVMRGIGPDDGILVFVSILQKFTARLSTDTHALMWADVGDERLFAGDVQSKPAASKLVSALKANAPVVLAAVFIDSSTQRVHAYRLSLGLHIIANQMDEHAALSTRPPYHLVLTGALLARKSAALYMSLFTADPGGLEQRYRATLTQSLDGYRQQPSETAANVLHALLAMAAVDYNDANTTTSTSSSTHAPPPPDVSTDVFGDLSSVAVVGPQRVRHLRHIASTPFVALESFALQVQTIYSLVVDAAAVAGACGAPVDRYIAAVCENITSFFRTLAHPGIEEVAEDVALLCGAIAGTTRTANELERLFVYLHYSRAVLKQSVVADLAAVGATALIEAQHTAIGDREYAEYLQGFDLSTIAWGLNNDLVLDVQQITKTSRLPPDIRHSAVITQYLIDTRMDETLRQLLLEVVGQTSLPANPYMRACTAFRRAMWLTELCTETDAKLQARITRTDPTPAGTEGMYSLGQPPIFGSSAVLTAMKPQAFTQVSELLKEVKTDAMAGRGEVDTSTAIWLSAHQAFSVSHRGVLVAFDCHEHTHLISSKRGRALELFVEHLTQALLRLAGGRCIISSINTPGASWSVDDVKYNAIELKSAVQFALQAREAVSIRIHNWTGDRFMSIRKNITLSISTNDGSLLLAPTAPSLGLAVKTAVFPTLDDAHTAQRFPTVQSTSRDVLLTQLGGQVANAHADNDMHAVFGKTVVRCALTGDWTLLPSLVRYFSSAADSLLACNEVLTTLISLQALEVESDELDATLQRQRQATSMQARGLVTRVLKYHALHLPHELQARIVSHLLGPMGSEDQRHIRHVQGFLHVLLRVVAHQLFAVLDDVRDAVRVQLSVLRAAGLKDERDDTTGKTVAGGARNARRQFASDKSSDRTKKTVVLEDDQPSGWTI
ncbi:hypothetical protein PTSG_03716 [Salpingoeca rosetta]|uniref:Uncharacterized protein n=1 Tax=Salpingoeca rosetta (strain ATCC 50818 / BSB-021) TaxID=946362 RepID=F2U6D7_SALR5|nr:uncharacterized protein PTSG_03716 [Salpingoeca rosetta]EGD83078.1 hypothetical protein PTSG_03716 [Salpingoeca rosetta]|eukprot:XP_004995442.1 hypothetical protein PTSG_03716 [Salpingoeca rosetta]